MVGCLTEGINVVPIEWSMHSFWAVLFYFFFPFFVILFFAIFVVVLYRNTQKKEPSEEDSHFRFEGRKK